MAILILIIFFIPIVFALVSPYIFIILTFLIGGIPLSWLTESRGSLESFKGMSASAIELFGFIIGMILIIGINIKKCAPYIPKYAFHLFFLIFACTSLLWTSDLIFGLRMLIKLIAPFLFIIGCAACIQNIKDAVNIEKAIFVGAILFLLFALSNYVFKYAPVFTANNISYLTVPGSSPAVFSFKMACVSLLALANYLVDRKKIYLVLCIIFSIAVILAFTRISMFGLIAASALVIFLLAKSFLFRTLVPLFLIIIFITSFLVSDTLKIRMFRNPDRIGNFSQIIADPEKAIARVHTSGRLHAWQVALNKFFVNNPIQGSGIGCTQAWFYEGSKKRVGVLHSEYLRLLCEVGLIGLFLFLLTIFKYSFLTLRGCYKKNTNVVRKYSCLSLSCILFYVITLATDNSFDYILAIQVYVFCFIYLSLLSQKLAINQHDLRIV
jgi:O-antigen ligase